MAKNDEDDVAEVDADAVEKAAEAAAKKKKILMLAIVGVVLLLVAGGGTWFALRALSGDKAPAAETPAEEHAPAEEGHEAAGEHKVSVYESLDPPFLANFQTGGRAHYLQVSIAVMARDDAAMTAVRTHMPLLRNRIVMLLSGEVFEQLQSDEGRVQLQQKLLAAIQEILQKETGKPQIEQVFFTNYVMQ